jgi:hypothetical protein
VEREQMRREDLDAVGLLGGQLHRRRWPDQSAHRYSDLRGEGLRTEVRHERGEELYVGKLLEAVLCGR